LIIFTDRPVDVGNENFKRTSFAQGSYSRVSTPSITIDGMDDDDDDEPSVSQAFISKADQRNMTFAALTTSDDSDDDLYQSVKSDAEDDYVS